MRKKKVQVSSDDESETESSDDASDSSSMQASPPKRKGRQRKVVNNKRQRVQAQSDDDGSPQPSTSRNGMNANEQSESDSGSETPDSDYGPVTDSLLVKKKKVLKKVPSQVSKNNKRKCSKNANRSKTSKKLNQSMSKLGKLSSPNGAISFDPQLVETLANKCVYFLLVENQKKYAIKRKAITTHVFKDEEYSAKLYLAVLKKSNSILKQVFGMELIELENQKDSYLIINILSRDLNGHEHIELSRIKQQQHGLILYILTVIFMNDNVISEDELTKSLKNLGIDLTSKRVHPIFGDVKKYITTELVKQMYLQYECVSKDPPRYEFTWGLRAKQEFDKSDLLQFACQIFVDTSPEDWKIQHKDALRSSQANTVSS